MAILVEGPGGGHPATPGASGGEAGDQVVGIAARAGRMMLENGSETNRAQDTVNTLCLSLGMAEADSFATPTGLMLTAVNPQGRSWTAVKGLPSD